MKLLDKDISKYKGKKYNYISFKYGGENMSYEHYCCLVCHSTPCCCPKGIQKLPGFHSSKGPKGERGLRGVQGPPGPRGITGPRGPQGLPGIAGSSAIIPYASGTPVTLTGILGGTVNTGALIGFGISAPSVNISSGTLTLGVGAGNIPDFAFVVPRAGTVTSISGFFSVTAGANLAETGTVIAQLWRAPAGSNTFTPTGAEVELAPSFGPGLVGVGDTAFNTAVTALPVTAGQKLLMVFSLDSTSTVADVLIGFASAGVAIS